MKKKIIVPLIVVLLIGIGFFFLPNIQSWWREYQATHPTDAPPVPADLQNTVDRQEQQSAERLPISPDRTSSRVVPKTDVLAYIAGFEQLGGMWYVNIDYVNWLTGDAAKQAALAAGDCSVPAACAPNGFYIDNRDSIVESFRVAPAVTIQMQTYRPTPDPLTTATIDFDTFRSFFAADAAEAVRYLQRVPYNIAFGSDGVVVKITEKYVP